MHCAKYILTAFGLVLVLISNSVSNAQTTFVVEVNKESVFFGESLTVTVIVTPWAAEIVDPVIEIRVPCSFTFGKANIRSVVCQDGNICEINQKSLNGNESFAVVPAFVFGNRVINESKCIPLVQNETMWPGRTSLRSVIQFDNAWSADIGQSLHFVIGRLRYQKMVSNGEDSNETAVQVEHVSGKYVSIFPVNISISLDGSLPNQGNGTRADFLFLEVLVKMDRRVGDAFILFPLTTDLTIMRAGYTMGDSQTVIDLPIPDDNALSIQLAELAFKDLANDWCFMNVCELRLFAVAFAEPRNWTKSTDRKEISIKASVFYGANFQSRLDSETLLLNFVQQQDTGEADAMEKSNATRGSDSIKGTSGPPATTRDSLANGAMGDRGSNIEVQIITQTANPLVGESARASATDVHEPSGADETDTLMTVEHATVKYTNESVPNRTVDVPADDNAISVDQSSATETERGIKAAGSCRDGWWTLELQMNDRCYHFPNQKMSFVDAEDYCREMGGHLPSYHSPYGLLTLTTFWKNRVPSSELWLGLSKSAYEDDWKWTDGSQYDFRNWCDIDEASSWANCTVISDNADSGYCWLNKACGQEFYFVCYEPTKQKALWWW